MNTYKAGINLPDHVVEVVTTCQCGAGEIVCQEVTNEGWKFGTTFRCTNCNAITVVSVRDKVLAIKEELRGINNER
jgi:hypothetical protein